LYTLIHKRACLPIKWFKYITETQSKSPLLLNLNLRYVKVKTAQLHCSRMCN